MAAWLESKVSLVGGGHSWSFPAPGAELVDLLAVDPNWPVGRGPDRSRRPNRRGTVKGEGDIM